MSAPRGLTDLAVLLAVAEARGFTQAPVRLELTPSTLSHAIGGFEERLGLRLFNRTTRSVASTDAGERLLRAARPGLEAIAAELAALAGLRDKPAGTVRITTSAHAHQTVLWPALRRVHPDVHVEVVTERLRAGGWRSAPTVSSSYRRAIWRVGPRETAYVLLRSRGINLLLHEVAARPMFDGNRVRVSTTAGRNVCHWYSFAGVNLHDFALDFALAFEEACETSQGASGGDLDRFFVARGQRPQPPPRPAKELGIRDIYDAISDGTGGPAYLSDGLWLHAGGGWSDD